MAKNFKIHKINDAKIFTLHKLRKFPKSIELPDLRMNDMNLPTLEYKICKIVPNLTVVVCKNSLWIAK